MQALVMMTRRHTLCYKCCVAGQNILPFGMNALLSVSSTSHLQLGPEDEIGTGWQPHWTKRAQPLPVLCTMWTTEY